MSINLDFIIRKVTGREVEPKFRRRVVATLATLPPTMSNTDSVVFDVVIREEYLHRLDTLSIDVAHRIIKVVDVDLPTRITKMTAAAISQYRDTLPTDVHAGMSRTIRWLVIWTTLIMIAFAGLGWAAGVRWERRERASHQASADVEFGRCVDAAAGRLVFNTRRARGEAQPTPDVVRTDLMNCGAEYADRRAGDR